MKVRKDFVPPGKRLKVGDFIEMKRPIEVTYGRVTHLSPEGQTFHATFEVFGYTEELNKSVFQKDGGIVHESKKMKRSLERLDKEIIKEFGRKIKNGEKPF